MFDAVIVAALVVGWLVGEWLIGRWRDSRRDVESMARHTRAGQALQ